MIFWLDAHISPTLASWMNVRYPEHQTIALRDLGLRDSDDITIFGNAKISGAVIITKDSDFINLVDYYGAPPQVIWLRCGHTSNASLQRILEKKFQVIVTHLQNNSPIVEVRES